MTTSRGGWRPGTSQVDRGGFGWRIGVSVATAFGFVIFLMLYFAFWSGSFSNIQSVVLVLVAMLAFVGINGAAWASWGARPPAVPDVPQRAG
ncbi:MAG TPA: hypothetical protein VFF67_09020 [Thermoplasmata archaeon]|nr:hypothetical protein [Thermoplasmata archaeon]